MSSSTVRVFMPQTSCAPADRGTAGVELHERWKGDARAYLGMTVPGFPNFFTIYGPNTNIVVNGSIIFFSKQACLHRQRLMTSGETGARL